MAARLGSRAQTIGRTGQDHGPEVGPSHRIRHP